jgi:hypothetical protein
MTTPLGGPYADRASVKRRASIPDSTTNQDEDVDDALSSASDAVNQYTGRQFGRTEVATSRSVGIHPSGYLDTDDFYTSEDLVIDGVSWVDNNTTWTLEPADGVLNGVPGYPFERITRYYASHPIYQALSNWPAARRSQVTARWGWASVPGAIRQATLMLAADHLKSKDAPFGVAGFGDYVVRVRANPKVQELLDPYKRDRLLVA